MELSEIKAIVTNNYSKQYRAHVVNGGSIGWLYRCAPLENR